MSFEIAYTIKVYLRYMGKGRVDPTPKQRKRLLERSAYRCCICKQRGLGLNLHHIDGDASNTVDENLAVLCVQDHDFHHRPRAYAKLQHLELSAEVIRKHKHSWESFVSEASKPNPQVAATMTSFGNENSVHTVQLVMQWSDEKIEYKRIWHQHDGGIDKWTDEIIAEVKSIGSNIPLVIISEPVSVKLCPYCGIGLSHTVKEEFFLKRTDDWKEFSRLIIYIHPKQPELRFIVTLYDNVVYSAYLHLCEGKYLNYMGDYFKEQFTIERRPSVRTQVTQIVVREIEEWQPSYIFIGTGNLNNLYAIDDLRLPKVWEWRRA